MLSAITCFVGYYPQGYVAHTMRAENTHTHTHTVTLRAIGMNRIWWLTAKISEKSWHKVSAVTVSETPRQSWIITQELLFCLQIQMLTIISQVSTTLRTAAQTVGALMTEKWHLRDFFLRKKTHWWENVFQEDQGLRIGYCLVWADNELPLECQRKYPVFVSCLCCCLGSWATAGSASENIFIPQLTDLLNCSSASSP